MKRFFHPNRCGKTGFSLVEVALSLGVFSFGFITLVPLLALGLNSARQSQNDATTAQIAATLAEEARQGTSVTGTSYFDFQGGACPAAQAVYRATGSFTSLPPATGTPMVQRLTLKVTPVGAPDRARIYAVVLPVAW
jgi:uncharacterized protein (TIGR02598 family)